jgi:hypothetical protein
MAAPSTTSRTVQPSIVVGFVSGNGIDLGKIFARGPMPDAAVPNEPVLCCAAEEAFIRSGR